MEILLFFKSHWLAVSFLAPILWAMINIVDVYFVDGIYKDELDGTIISGLFQILPWPIILLLTGFDLKDVVGLGASDSGIVFLTLFSGILYALSLFFYFKALFKKNDVSLLQILWNLTIIAVPFLSFLFFRETLSFMEYAGMAVVLFGASALSFNTEIRNNFSKKYFGIMLGAVLLLSLSMILQGQAYDQLFNTHGSEGFWLGFFLFSLGSFTAGLFLAIFTKRNPFILIKKYYKIFIVVEGGSFFGIMASQKALDIAPSASFVAVIETFVPVFILVYSLIILFLFSVLAKKKNEVVKRIYSEQIGGIWIKILAIVIMAAGVYLMS